MRSLDFLRRRNLLQNLSISALRPFSTEMQHQLPSNLIKIMEQRMAAIEQKSAYLQEQINLEIDGLKSLISNSSEDTDMCDMAAEELNGAMQEEKRLQHLLLKSLLPKDDADERDSIIEVRAGTGGEEASLFAMDIFKMYERYSQKKGWKFDIVDIMESDVKGYKEASATISGLGVYGNLKFESGVHTVQVDVQLQNEDLKIDTYRAGGCGGQSVNTTNSAVRVTHIPTGITVVIQDERSQHMNKAKALKVLCARLYDTERSRVETSRSKLRSEQVGSDDRSELIRTYNFPQGRVTDHRIGITHHSIEDVMEGVRLDVFIDSLLLREEMDSIASFSAY